MSPHSCAKSTACTKPRVHTWPINCNIIPQKDTMMPYMAQLCYPLNSQALAIIFPSATIPAMPHYPEYTDRYFPQYGRLLFLLHFMTNTLFFNLPSPTLKSFLNTWPAQSCVHHHRWPHWQNVSGHIPPPSLSHSLNLGCFTA